MGEIYLVRHGQANSHAKTEEDYDRLSPLGHQQSVWLGEWLRAHDYSFDHVVSGTMRRHRETVAGMGYDADEDARLNEIDYYGLSHAMRDQKGVPLPGPHDFADHMPKVFEAWAQAEIEGAETYQAFETRVSEMLEEAAKPGRRVLCVTSGGVIGMVLTRILGLDLLRLSHVMLPIFNSSLHKLHVRPGGPILAGYNAIPHLEAPERADKRTHY